jgi:hypothetical protein
MILIFSPFNLTEIGFRKAEVLSIQGFNVQPQVMASRLQESYKGKDGSFES